MYFLFYNLNIFITSFQVLLTVTIFLRNFPPRFDSFPIPKEPFKICNAPRRITQIYWVKLPVPRDEEDGTEDDDDRVDTNDRTDDGELVQDVPQAAEFCMDLQFGGVDLGYDSQ